MSFALNDYFSSSKYMKGIISRNMGFLMVCLMASLVLGTEGLLGDWTPPYDDACIRGYNDQIKDEVDSLDECKEYCEETLGFNCNSVEYNPNGRRCVLSVANELSVANSDYPEDFTQPCYVEGTTWIYAEVYFYKNWNSEIPNACIIGNNNIVLYQVSLNICKAYCEKIQGLELLSVEYNLSANICSLSTSNSNSDAFQLYCSDSDWIFTEISGGPPPPAAAVLMAPAAAVLMAPATQDENEDQPL